MQAALKMFQIVAPQGGTMGCQTRKIALKLPAIDAIQIGKDDLDFNEIMESLLPASHIPMTPDELEASMESLDWLPMDASALDQSIPVIDLTDPDADNRAALEMLLSMAGETLNPEKSADPESLSRTGRSAFTDLKEQTTRDPIAGGDPSPEKTMSREREVQVVQEALSELATGKIREEEPAARSAAELQKMQTQLPDEEASAELNQVPAKNNGKRAGKHKDLSSRLATGQDPAGIEGEDAPKTETIEGGKKTATGSHRPASRDVLSFDTESAESKPVESSSGSVHAKAVSPDSTSGGKDTGHKISLPSEMDRSQLQDEAASHRDNLPTIEKGGEGSDIRAASNAHDRMHAATSSQAGGDTAQPPRDMQTDVIRQIVDRMTLRSDRGQSEMKIRLKPEFLGDLRLHVATENHHVMVRITADSPAVKEMIEHNLPMLKTELQQHGLQIDKFDVFVGQDQETWKHRQQQNASHDARRFKQRYTGRKNLDALEETEADQVSGPWRRQPESAMKEVDFFA